MKQGEAPSILVFIPLMLSCNVDRLSNNNRVKVAPASIEWSNSTLTSDGWMDASPSAESNSTSSLLPFVLCVPFCTAPQQYIEHRLLHYSSSDHTTDTPPPLLLDCRKRSCLALLIGWACVRACELDEVRPPNARGSVTEASAATHTRITDSFTCSLPASRQPLQGTRTRTQARRIAISVAIDHPCSLFQKRYD